MHVWETRSASRAALSFAFSKIAVERLAGRTDPPNQASRRVLEKLGMRYHDTTVENGLTVVNYWMERKDWNE